MFKCLVYSKVTVIPPRLITVELPYAYLIFLYTFILEVFQVFWNLCRIKWNLKIFALFSTIFNKYFSNRCNVQINGLIALELSNVLQKIRWNILSL